MRVQQYIYCGFITIPLSKVVSGPRAVETRTAALHMPMSFTIDGVLAYRPVEVWKKPSITRHMPYD